MPTARHDSIAFTVVVVVLTAVGALLVLVVLALSGAPSIVLLATALAAVPVGPVVACYLWLDRYEPEPRRLLVAGLAWGAFVATVIALVLEGVGGFVVGMGTASLAVVAPVVEEATKGLFLVLLLWWRRAEIDGVLDGIVYAGMVGVGFAFTENILYLSAAYDGTGTADAMAPGGLQAITGTFVLRCVFSPFAHPLFTAFTGVGVGLAVASRRPAVRVLAPIGGYLLAVLAHGLWNGSTVYGGEGFLTVYVAVMLPATDIGWITNLTARRAARRFAEQAGGPRAKAAMREYQQAAVELGFLHHRLLRGTAPSDWQARGAEFVARIQSVRPYVAFPGQAVPVR